MRAFATAFPAEITQQPVARLPWGHVTVLLNKFNDQNEREWYAAAAAEYGWSHNVLLNQIMNQLHPGPPLPRRTSPTSCPLGTGDRRLDRRLLQTPAAGTAGAAASARPATRTDTRSQLRATRPQHDRPAYTLAGG
jgi:hypothetical protein